MDSKQKHILHIGIPYIVLSVLTLLLSGADLYLNVTQKNSNLAVPEVFYGDISGDSGVKVSADGKIFSLKVTVPSGYGKYYLKTPWPNKNLEAIGSACDTKNNCVRDVHHRPWFSYRTNSEGIARIDYKLAAGTYTSRFRPYNSNEKWSDTVEVVVSSQAKPSSSSVTSIADYLIYESGYTWMYISKNHRVKDGKEFTTVTGNTRIQIEQETEICGVRVRPWRFTKDKPEAYWNPLMFSFADYWGNRNLRWFVVSPDFNYTANAKYNNHFWVFGDKTYQNPGDPEFFRTSRNLTSDPLGRYLLFLSKGDTPAYNLAPKTITGNQYMHVAEKQSYYMDALRSEFSQYLTSNKCPTNGMKTPQALGSNSTWKVRIEKDRLKIDNPNFKYDGEALRLDHFEGSGTLEKEQLLRETWYFIKGIGLAKIVGVHFNNYNHSGAPACKDNSDCFNDHIENPDFEVTLDRYFQNPTLIVSAAKEGSSSFRTTVSTDPGKGYVLKATYRQGNKTLPYTGYLEASGRFPNHGNVSSVNKWYWADEKGEVIVPYRDIASLAGGVEVISKFRVWIPNENIEWEKRVGTNNLPWSNEIHFKVN